MPWIDACFSTDLISHHPRPFAVDWMPSTYLMSWPIVFGRLVCGRAMTTEQNLVHAYPNWSPDWMLMDDFL